MVFLLFCWLLTARAEEVTRIENPPHNPQSKPGDEEAFKKSKKEIEDLLLQTRTEGITVNGVKLDGRYYSVMGGYESDLALEMFVMKLMDANKFDSRIYKELGTTMFGGVKTKTYTLTGLNLWK